MHYLHNEKMRLSSLEEVVNKLANQEPLEPKYRDHALSGDYSDFREDHIKPDWLLVYCVDDDELELFLLYFIENVGFFR